MYNRGVLSGVCDGWLLQYNNTPLHNAARDGHSEAVQLLLTADGDPNANAQSNGTPLHKAAENGHSEAVKLLLAANSDPNARNEVIASPAAVLCDAIVRC